MSDDKKTKRRKGESVGEHRRRTSKAESIEAAGDTKINKGLAGLAKKVESQAEGVEKAKPTPTPTPKRKGGGEDKDVDDPAPGTPMRKPLRKQFPEGLAGEAAYQKAVREFTKRRKER